MRIGGGGPQRVVWVEDGRADSRQVILTGAKIVALPKSGERPSRLVRGCQRST